MPPLPLEILLLIIEAIRPANPDALLSPRHDTTKTLLSLTRVSKALYWPAMQALRQHCVYLDTRERAQIFCRCLSLSPPSFLKQQGAPDRGLKGIQNLFVACFPGNDDFVPSQEIVSPELTARVEAIDNVVDPELLDDAANYSPVSDASSSESSVCSPLDDLATAAALFDIFQAVSPCLKRLVIDMPLRTLWPEHDKKSVKKILWRAFESLVNLEEFTSVRDELFLYAHYQRDWRFDVWPKLRRLSLYNPDLEAEISYAGMVHTFQRLEFLEKFVCSRADGLEEGVDLLKEMYSDSVTGPDEPPSTGSKKLTFVHVNVKGIDFMTWNESNPLSRLHLIKKEVAVPLGPEFERDVSDWPCSPGDIVQDWVLQRSLEGTLWDDSIVT